MVIKKIFYLFFLMVLPPVVSGQNIRTIEIDATKSVNELNLSEIAAEVVAIPLENENNFFDDVFLSDKYLFVAAQKRVFQYDLTGKLIGKIEIGQWINSLTGDISKEMLIVTADKQILFYNFAGKLMDKAEVKDPVYSCFLHNNKIWLQSCKRANEDDYTLVSKISYWDMNTKQEYFTSFEYMQPPADKNVKANIVPRFAFSILKNKVVISSSTTDSLYEINGKEIKPIIKWNIHPPARTIYEQGMISKKGIIGKYLFINYNRTLTKAEEISQSTSYLYLEDLQSKKAHNVKFEYSLGGIVSGIKDDIYHTGYCKIDSPINKNGYFFFVKSKNNIQGESINNLPLKEGSVIFIVKTRQ